LPAWTLQRSRKREFPERAKLRNTDQWRAGTKHGPAASQNTIGSNPQNEQVKQQDSSNVKSRKVYAQARDIFAMFKGLLIAAQKRSAFLLKEIDSDRNAE
jgi:hypothetical protein